MLVLSVENPFYGVLDFTTGEFGFITNSKVLDVLTVGIDGPETTDLSDDRLLHHKELISPLKPSGRGYKKGDMVSFDIICPDGSQMNIKGYYLDSLEDPPDYCLISERGSSVCKWWRVPKTKTRLEEAVNLR